MTACPVSEQADSCSSEVKRKDQWAEKAQEENDLHVCSCAHEGVSIRYARSWKTHLYRYKSNNKKKHHPQGEKLMTDSQKLCSFHMQCQ